MVNKRKNVEEKILCYVGIGYIIIGMIGIMINAGPQSISDLGTLMIFCTSVLYGIAIIILSFVEVKK